MINPKWVETRLPEHYAVRAECERLIREAARAYHNEQIDHAINLVLRTHNLPVLEFPLNTDVKPEDLRGFLIPMKTTDGKKIVMVDTGMRICPECGGSNVDEGEMHEDWCSHVRRTAAELVLKGAVGRQAIHRQYCNAVRHRGARCNCDQKGEYSART